LIEQTTASLCHALDGSASVLGQAVSAHPGSNIAVAHAADALINQLRLRRAAWGPADAPVSLHQITTLARGLPNDVLVDLSALPEAIVFPAAFGRIVLNILLLAADSLPQGGHVVLAGTMDDMFVRILGPVSEWPIGIALCLADEAEAQSALTDGRDVQMAVTAMIAHAAGIRLSALLPPANLTEPAILRLGG
jgi:histidine phosphotransferase ChpT